MPSSNVMPQFKLGALRSGSKTGPAVRNRKQAVAILLSEKRKEGKNGGLYPDANPKPKNSMPFYGAY